MLYYSKQGNKLKLIIAEMPLSTDAVNLVDLISACTITCCDSLDKTFNCIPLSFSLMPETN